MLEGGRERGQGVRKFLQYIWYHSLASVRGGGGEKYLAQEVSARLPARNKYTRTRGLA